jgi:hypothetical protein
MQKKAMFVANHSVDSDSKTESVVCVGVEYNAEEIAAAIGVPVNELLARLWQVAARSLCVDAAAIAEQDVRARGGLFPFQTPPGWPLAYLAAVTEHRLFDADARGVQ